jgi:hypothetical protein
MYLVSHVIGWGIAPTQDAQATGLGDGSAQFGCGDPGHSSLKDRIAYVQKVTERGVNHDPTHLSAAVLNEFMVPVSFQTVVDTQPILC